MVLRRSMRARALTAVATFAVIALAAAACSNANDGGKGATDTASKTPATTFKGTDYSKNVPVQAQGVTSTEIRVASITSKTNPIGGDNARLNDGLKAYFAKVNANHGIWGRKIVLVRERDDQTGNNATETEAMLAQDNVYSVFEAVELFTGASKLAAAGIPTFGWNINAEWAGPKNFFPNVPPLCVQDCPTLGRLFPWVAKQLHAHRVAVMAYNVPQSSGAMKGVLGSFTKFGKDAGAQVVFSDLALNFGQTDYSAQVAQMKAKKADMLVTALDFNGDYAIAKEMDKQGILKQVTFLHPNLYNREFVQKNAAVLNGGVVLVPILAVEHAPAPPALQEYLDAMKARGIVPTELSEQGWFAARQFVDALKATGPNFTWANLISTWNQQKWYSAGVEPPIDWTTQHDAPNTSPAALPRFECANFVRIVNGQFVGIWDDGGKKPWVCFNGKAQNQWATPVNLSFAGAPFSPASVFK